MADEEEPVVPKLPKVLIVVTSVDVFPGDDATPTGFYLSEVVHPYNVFIKNGWEVGFASISGTAVADPSSVESADTECLAFWDDAEKKALLEAPTKLADIVEAGTFTADYDALYFAGGFGCMWDYPESAEAQTMIKAMLDAEKKIVAAVCHGPIVFANIVGGDEAKLLADKVCTGFTNAEETAMSKLEVVSKPSGPGSCQDLLTEVGAKFQVGVAFAPQVVECGNIFTGQNPASAAPLATAIVYYFDTIKGAFEPQRLAMLKAREALVSEIKAADAKFAADLAATKESEKLEELQMKAKVGASFRATQLADLDNQLARNAMLRQKALDDAAAAAAATEEE